MLKTLLQVRLAPGREVFLLRDEKGRRQFYDENGFFLCNVEGEIEVIRELGRIETEQDFITLAGCRPSAWIAICPFCHEESLVSTTLEKWYCPKCKLVVPAVDESTDRIN